jgi:hypothetical protein
VPAPDLRCRAAFLYSSCRYQFSPDEATHKAYHSVCIDVQGTGEDSELLASNIPWNVLYHNPSGSSFIVLPFLPFSQARLLTGSNNNQVAWLDRERRRGELVGVTRNRIRSRVSGGTLLRLTDVPEKL